MSHALLTSTQPLTPTNPPQPSPSSPLSPFLSHSSRSLPFTPPPSHNKKPRPHSPHPRKLSTRTAPSSSRDPIPLPPSPPLSFIPPPRKPRLTRIRTSRPPPPPLPLLPYPPRTSPAPSLRRRLLPSPPTPMDSLAGVASYEAAAAAGRAADKGDEEMQVIDISEQCDSDSGDSVGHSESEEEEDDFLHRPLSPSNPFLLICNSLCSSPSSAASIHVQPLALPPPSKQDSRIPLASLPDDLRAFLVAQQHPLVKDCEGEAGLLPSWMTSDHVKLLTQLFDKHVAQPACFDVACEALIRIQHSDGTLVRWMAAEEVLQWWKQPGMRERMQIASLQTDAAGEAAAGEAVGSRDRLVYAPLLHVVEPFVYEERYAARMHPRRIRAPSTSSAGGALDLLLTPDHNLWAAPYAAQPAEADREREHPLHPYQLIPASALDTSSPAKSQPLQEKGWHIKTSAPISSSVDYSFTLPAMDDLLCSGSERDVDISPFVQRHTDVVDHPASTSSGFVGEDMDAFLTFLGFHIAHGTIDPATYQLQCLVPHAQCEYSEAVCARLAQVMRRHGSLVFTPRLTASRPQAHHRGPAGTTAHEAMVGEDGGYLSTDSESESEDDAALQPRQYHRVGGQKLAWLAPHLALYLLLARLFPSHTSHQQQQQPPYTPLPQWVWLLSARQIRIFLGAMAPAHDSADQPVCKLTTATSSIVTSCKAHADELHALAMHAGLVSAMLLSSVSGQYEVTLHHRSDTTTRTGTGVYGGAKFIHVDERSSTRLRRFWCVGTAAASTVILVRRRVDDFDATFPNPCANHSMKEAVAGGAAAQPTVWVTAYVGNCTDKLAKSEWEEAERGREGKGRAAREEGAVKDVDMRGEKKGGIAGSSVSTSAATSSMSSSSSSFSASSQQQPASPLYSLHTNNDQPTPPPSSPHHYQSYTPPRPLPSTPVPPPLLSPSLSKQTSRIAETIRRLYGLSSEEKGHKLLGHCFPSSDTRVLTDVGFQYLDEVETRLAAGERVLYACYDTSCKALRYTTGSLVFPPEPPSHLIHFRSSDAEQQLHGLNNTDFNGGYLSLRVTPPHRMFVANDALASRRASTSVGLIPAEELLPISSDSQQTESCPSRSTAVRMIACAEAGHIPLPDTVERKRVQSSIGLSDDHQFSAFLQLLGFWLGAGSLSYASCGYAAVRFTQLNSQDRVWLQTVAMQAGLGVQDIRVVRCEQTMTFLITHPRWFAWFDHEFGRLYPDSAHYHPGASHEPEERPIHGEQQSIDEAEDISEVQEQSSDDSSSTEQQPLFSPVKESAAALTHIDTRSCCLIRHSPLAALLFL